jgi:hypothetical protein
LFARLIKEFGLSWETVMAMPLKRFWFMSNMVERLWAERDLRQVQLMASVGSQDGFTTVLENLKKERGTIYVWEQSLPTKLSIDPKTGLDPDFDRGGLHALKGKGRVKG